MNSTTIHLEGFQFGWWETKEIEAAFPTSITLISYHLHIITRVASKEAGNESS